MKNDEFVYIVDLIDKYSMSYYKGNFEECNQTFLNIITQLMFILENNKVNAISTENLSVILNVYEQKNWVFLNDLLVNEIRRELSMNA